jgi:predicted metalloprotease with PDZ domain
MKIYWSGAALALMADVELRHRSGGAESLDLVLDRMQACCLPSRRTWSGRELFEKFDSLIDEPLFVRLYERYANTRGFPEFEPLLESPEFAEIRATITARRYTGEPDK